MPTGGRDAETGVIERGVVKSVGVAVPPFESATEDGDRSTTTKIDDCTISLTHLVFDAPVVAAPGAALLADPFSARLLTCARA
jgi:hypothetical protein